jgi:hypothetical protein
MENKLETAVISNNTFLNEVDRKWVRERLNYGFSLITK